MTVVLIRERNVDTDTHRGNDMKIGEREVYKPSKKVESLNLSQGPQKKGTQQ